MKLTRSPAWEALAAHRKEMDGVRIRDLFDSDAGRFERFSRRLDPGLLFDFSKHRITEQTLRLLVALAEGPELLEGDRGALDWRLGQARLRELPLDSVELESEIPARFCSPRAEHRSEECLGAAVETVCDLPGTIEQL